MRALWKKNWSWGRRTGRTVVKRMITKTSLVLVHVQRKVYGLRSRCGRSADAKTLPSSTFLAVRVSENVLSNTVKRFISAERLSASHHCEEAKR